MEDRAESVLKTLLYSDIFDYPLKREEILKYLISDKKIGKKTVFSSLDNLLGNKKIGKKNGYYFLEGKDENVLKRLERKEISLAKIKKGKAIIVKLKKIPLIKFVGISGALSMENSDKRDDIDIFVIAQKGFVWTARFFLIMALTLIGAYRRKNSKDYADKICLNLILDESNIRFKEENIYVAHEIAQLIPVMDKDNAYKRFIEENRKWINRFLPNALEEKPVYEKSKTGSFSRLFTIFAKVILIERLMGFLQKKYMEKDVTKEEIRDGFLGFHPFDYKAYVIKIYKNKLARMRLCNKKNSKI